MTVEDHVLTTIGGQAPVISDDKLYAVACDTRYLRKNPVLSEYCALFPHLVQPEDAGFPLLPILVEYFCGLMWLRLLDHCLDIKKEDAKSGREPSKVFENLTHEEVEIFFSTLDANGDGSVSPEELLSAVKKALGEKLSSKIVVEQMFGMIDYNGDGSVDCAELKKAMLRLSEGATEYGNRDRRL